MAIKMTQKEMEEYITKVKNREKRYQIKTKLMLQKAAAAGIKVTDAEIDAELKK